MGQSVRDITGLRDASASKNDGENGTNKKKSQDEQDEDDTLHISGTNQSSMSQTSADYEHSQDTG